MNQSEVLGRRLSAQLLGEHELATPQNATPQSVVSHLGAVQAQEYAEAKWALGLRLAASAGASDSSVEQALDDGTILRTHIMRPTWHLVAPADIRWLTALTAPRVQAKMTYYNRILELDEAVFARSRAALEQALQGGVALTRQELGAALGAAGILATGQRLGHLMMEAELEALITSGPRRGKQFTYMLLDERVPPTPKLERDAALAELARRYVTSHGPATAQDFAWWSGLTVTDAKLGLELNSSDLEHQDFGEQTYHFAPTPTPSNTLTTHLLPAFDEFTVAYQDRSHVFERQADTTLSTELENVLKPRYATLAPVLVVSGVAAGFWKRTLKKDRVIVTVQRARALSEAETESLAAALERYRQFLGVADLELVTS